MAIKRILKAQRMTASSRQLKNDSCPGVAPWESLFDCPLVRVNQQHSFDIGLANSRSALSQIRTKPDLVTLVGLKTVTVVSLVQPQRSDCRLIDCSRDWQAIIPLEIRDGRSRIDAQRACDWTIIVTCILQRSLDVPDDFVREQITVRVD